MSNKIDSNLFASIVSCLETVSTPQRPKAIYNLRLRLVHNNRNLCLSIAPEIGGCKRRIQPDLPLSQPKISIIAFSSLNPVQTFNNETSKGKVMLLKTIWITEMAILITKKIRPPWWSIKPSWKKSDFQLYLYYRQT